MKPAVHGRAVRRLGWCSAWSSLVLGRRKLIFAAALGEDTGLPVVHLDRHFWRPGWVEMPREGWCQRQRELFAGERWIADGNYGGSFDERSARADTVVTVIDSDRGEAPPRVPGLGAVGNNEEPWQVGPG